MRLALARGRLQGRQRCQRGEDPECPLDQPQGMRMLGRCGEQGARGGGVCHVEQSHSAT